MKDKNKLNWKKIGLSILYPHIAVLISLFPISILFLILSLVYLKTTSILAILSYLLSFYVLIIVSFRIPRILNFFKSFKEQNKFMQRWSSDVNMRINISLYTSLAWNIAFASFHLVLGFHHKSFWFFSIFAYYTILGIMRFFLVKRGKIQMTKDIKIYELKKSIICGWLLIPMNLALAVIIFFIVYWNKTFTHHMITVIAMSAYTFTTFTYAIINLVRYKKYNNAVYSSAKIISLIAGCVSILTLETSMLTTFGSTENRYFRNIIISLTGFAVVSFAITMAIIMIMKGNKKLKQNKHCQLLHQKTHL